MMGSVLVLTTTSEVLLLGRQTEAGFYFFFFFFLCYSCSGEKLIRSQRVEESEGQAGGEGHRPQQEVECGRAGTNTHTNTLTLDLQVDLVK